MPKHQMPALRQPAGYLTLIPALQAFMQSVYRPKVYSCSKEQPAIHMKYLTGDEGTAV
ncbi:MAG: hypothetical protein JWR68_891 [Polaromonas sp.]|nr:hypothetical protein [Polaromonas sp.]